MPYESGLFGQENPVEGLNPNLFGAAAGAAYSQTIETPYDFYTPQELTDLYYQHKKSAPGFAMKLRMGGMTWGAMSTKIGHYEKTWGRDQLVVGSVVVAGGGLTAVITLDASSMYTVPGTTIRGSYPIVTEIYELPGSRKQFQIISKDTTANPNTVNVQVVDPADPLAGADFTSGMRVFHVGNAQGEGTPLPGGKVSRVTKYTNTFQILGSKVMATGSEMTNKPYFSPVTNSAGIPTGSYLAVGLEDLIMNHEMDKDNALLFGKQITDINVIPPLLGYPVPVRGTEGLIEFGLTAGFDQGWDTATGYDMQDIDSVTLIYEGQRVGTKLMAWQGFNAYQAVENCFVDYQKQRTITILDESKGTSATVKVGMYGVDKSGYEIIFNKMSEFSDVKGAGTVGYEYRNWQIFTPWGWTQDQNSGDEVGFLGYQWKQLQNYSRENVMVKLDGTGFTNPALASYTDDVFQCGYRSEISAHYAVGNAIVIQRPE